LESSEDNLLLPSWMCTEIKKYAQLPEGLEDLHVNGYFQLKSLQVRTIQLT